MTGAHPKPPKLAPFTGLGFSPPQTPSLGGLPFFDTFLQVVTKTRLSPNLRFVPGLPLSRGASSLAQSPFEFTEPLGSNVLRFCAWATPVPGRR